MTVPATRLIFAVASHLHMTAGTVREKMSAHELMCWAVLLGTSNNAGPAEPKPLELDVDAEIAAFR
jgi:hypothetical protein